jgi:hypothetical protein
LSYLDPPQPQPISPDHSTESQIIIKGNGAARCAYKNGVSAAVKTYGE